MDINSNLINIKYKATTYEHYLDNKYMAFIIRDNY